MASSTLMPFLYPSLVNCSERTPRLLYRATRLSKTKRVPHCLQQRRRLTTASATAGEESQQPPSSLETSERDLSHLDPTPDSYSITPFTDNCTLTVQAGNGGHGCISFLREIFIANGPPNGGDGGTGGSIYIQAVRGETSLHKLARRGILKAKRGRNGQGKSQGGERGEDMLITVPVGTIVREIWRHDPVEEEELADKRALAQAVEGEEDEAVLRGRLRRDKWLLYPGALPSSFNTTDFPALPKTRRSHLALTQPAAPIRLDLDKPMEAPMLLAAGAMGGLGNPHFVTKGTRWPKFATKGDEGMKLEIQLELKLLADVGLVGLPNAGKSTLLRAVTNSKARIGNWAFTTLQPNIGTVVLDNHKGRPALSASTSGRRTNRTNFTIADIPGLIEGAHLDRGLGLGFLRHIERAAVLAFVVDLSAGDAVTALQGLWHEVGAYELLRDRELNAETERRSLDQGAELTFQPFNSAVPDDEVDVDEARGRGSSLLDHRGDELPPIKMPPISSKPWLVIATKADLDGTRENFAALSAYLDRVARGEEVHPSGKKNAWRQKLHAVPVSAIKAEGVERLPGIVVDLLDD